jgi:hypothetical protein
MSSLRELYKHLDSVKAFALDDLVKPLKLDFPVTERLKKTRRKPIRITQLSKVEPVEETLLPHHEELEQPRSEPMGLEQPKLSKVPFVGLNLGTWSLSSKLPETTVDLDPSLSVQVTSHSQSGQLSSRGNQFLRGDCHRVVVDGVIDELELRVHAEAFWEQQRIEMYFCFQGFQESTHDFLKQLCDPSYCDELDRVGLSDHIILFSTTQTRVRTSRASLPIQRGINVVATLELGPNLAALVETDTAGKKLDLYGAIPEEEGADLRFYTAPLMTLKTPTFDLEQAYLLVVTQWNSIPGEEEDLEEEDLRVRETLVTLLGTTVVGERRRTLWAEVPREHELLQLRMSTPRGARRIKLEELDPLLACGKRWRKILPPGLRTTRRAFSIQDYTCNLSLPLGKVVSILATLRTEKVAMEFDDGGFYFPSLEWRWVVGLPEDPDSTNLFAEGEGDVFLLKNGLMVFNYALEATISFKPRFLVRALYEDAPRERILTLVKAFEIGNRPPRGRLTSLEPPYEGIFTLDADGVSVACIGANEALVIWPGAD